MLSVSNNLGILIGHRGLRNAQSIINQAAERLMTGKRVNRASDDPAGMVAINEFEARTAVLKAELKSLDDREALLGAKEGAYSVINDLLLELDGLVVSAANTGAMTDEDREALQVQADSILEGLDFIYTTSRFRGESLFSGLYTTGAGRVQVDGEQDPEASIDDDDPPPDPVYAYLASLKSGGVLNLIDGDHEAAQESVQGALKAINLQRATIGDEILHSIHSDRQIRLVELENITQAQSNIEDADIAREVSELVRGQILQQASIYSILIAGQSPHAALQLLQSSVNFAAGR
jgi:flagellin